MSVTQMTPQRQGAEPLCCTRCMTVLPREATFCGHCGERVDKQGDTTSSPNNTTIEERYHLYNPIHRLSSKYANQVTSILLLSHAFDSQQGHPVIIRDLDVSCLPEEQQAQAIETAQNEYDLLRKLQHPDIMPVIDLHFYDQHIYTISTWPQNRKREGSTEQRPTLQHLLQSGIGLPDPEIALTWGYRICRALQQLHQHNIFISHLDPQTLAMTHDDYDGLPILMVSWLPQEIRTLLKTQAGLQSFDPSNKHFIAPEVPREKPDARSDVYSVGALLYLLLTGSPPPLPQKTSTNIRSPRNLVPTISTNLNDTVLQALSFDPHLRFQSADEFADVLLGLCSSTKTVNPLQLPPSLSKQDISLQPTATLDKNAIATYSKQEKTKNGATPDKKSFASLPDPKKESEDAITIKVTPLQMQQAHLYLSQLAAEIAIKEDAETSTPHRNPWPSEIPNLEEPFADHSQTANQTPIDAPIPSSSQNAGTQHNLGTSASQLLNNFRQRISGKLPAIKGNIPGFPTQLSDRLSIAAQNALHTDKPRNEQDITWLKRLQHFIFGEQHHNTTAAAIIEAPLRIQPNQPYNLRIHLMGRDSPTEEQKTANGISGLVFGEKVHVEVRSALFQNFAYIVQQANVEIPHSGYAAEVTIPMQPLTEGPSGRRERLHIQFSDELKRPLYERPFVLEIYISHIVQSGQEGYNALTIPL